MPQQLKQDSQSVSKPTPGPWKRRSIPGHLFELSNESGPVLRIRSGMMPTLEDANVLAAAPDMLEALEAFVALNLSAAPGSPVGWARTKAKAAIARAKGGA